MTDPGPYAHLFDSLPTDIPALVKTLQRMMDRVAALTLADDFVAIRALYEEDAGFHPSVEWNESGE